MWSMVVILTAKVNVVAVAVEAAEQYDMRRGCCRNGVGREAEEVEVSAAVAIMRIWVRAEGEYGAAVGTETATPIVTMEV